MKGRIAVTADERPLSQLLTHRNHRDVLEVLSGFMTGEEMAGVRESSKAAHDMEMIQLDKTLSNPKQLWDVLSKLDKLQMARVLHKHFYPGSHYFNKLHQYVAENDSAIAFACFALVADVKYIDQLRLAKCLAELKDDQQPQHLIDSIALLDEVLLSGVVGLHTILTRYPQAYINLHGADLKNIAIQSADLRGANLSWTSLKYSSLWWSNLEGATLEGAQLRHTFLRETNLKNACLKCADMRDANLYRADLTKANLILANLKNADLRKTTLDGAKLQGARAEGARMDQVDGRSANFHRANLTGASMNFSKFDGSTFSKAGLALAGLFNTSMKNTDLKGAKRKLVIEPYVNHAGAEVKDDDRPLKRR